MGRASPVTMSSAVAPVALMESATLVYIERAA